ncbi:MAG: LamG domain-containing protein [Chloroflexi bacterium]|nr:LamG domain-containing protein [Chloroflexota bacterium]
MKNSKTHYSIYSQTFKMGIILTLVILAVLGVVNTGSVRAGDNGGGALEFDGVDDYVELPAGAAFADGTGTIEFWLKSDDLSSQHHGVYISNSTDFELDGFCTGLDVMEFHLSTSHSLMAVVYQDGATCARIANIENPPPTTITPGEWHHLAATFDTSGMMTAYLNGSVEQSVDMSGYSFAGHSPTIVRIGKPGRNIRFLDGQIEEVRIWDTVRTQAEIRQTMFVALSGNEPGLRAYWKLDNGSGQIVTDSQAAGNYGGALGSNVSVGSDDPTWIAASTAPIGDAIVANQVGISGMWSVVPSTASSGLSISNLSFLQDIGDDIIFGHNNLVGNTTADVPVGVEQRWSRVWNCDLNDEGGNGGNVNLIFDFDDAGMGNGSPPNGNASNYKLLERAGASGPFSVIASANAYDIGQQTVTFNNVDTSSLCSYITLGTVDAANSPTAVTLQSISASSRRAINGFALAVTGVLGTAILLTQRNRHLIPFSRR